MAAVTSAVTKAVIPAAGLGTRFLPATKAVPKELLPLDDRPVLQHIVGEAVAAGFDEVCIISSPGKDALRQHFEIDASLEWALATKGDDARLAAVRAVTAGAELDWRLQAQPLGLGHAVAQAEDFAAGDPVAVLLGDDLLDASTPALADMAAVRQALGGSVLLLVEVPEAHVSRYGIAAVEEVPSPAGLEHREVVRVTGLQEKPVLEEAASRLALIGRYVLDAAIFAALRRVEPGAGGEIQLTDAIAALVDASPQDGGGVHAIVFRGRRYDTGDRLEYVKAVVEFAARDAVIGAEVRTWLDGAPWGDGS
jgi:UTP--glucose-1-phosphate uridylyltransferase